MNAPNRKKDRLFAEQMLPGDFVFDEKVADVFEDMVNRSIPGYSSIVSMIAILAESYTQTNSKIYDLGCSLGGTAFAIAQQLPSTPCSIVAIDNSPAMISRMEKKRASFDIAMAPIECRCEDLLTLSLIHI